MSLAKKRQLTSRRHLLQIARRPRAS